jgi:hypothetical protein
MFWTHPHAYRTHKSGDTVPLGKKQILQRLDPARLDDGGDTNVLSKIMFRRLKAISTVSTLPQKFSCQKISLYSSVQLFLDAILTR